MRATLDTELTILEVSELTRHEEIIRRGLNTFVEVGAALLAIRDGKLYRAEFGTFEDYCRDKWNMSRIHAHRMIEAANVASNLLPIGNILPSTESQARPLTSLEPDQQREAWALAVQTAPDGKITASHVERVVQALEKHTPHVSYNSGNNEWYTPAEYIEAAREVLGSIDLDPASSEIANQIVKAKRFYSENDDGLTRRWRGRVWMNPPYSSELIGQFTAKLCEHIRSGDITEAIVLVNNATEAAWFEDMADLASTVMFTYSRIKFLDVDLNPRGAPLQGQALLYFGSKHKTFIKAFSKLAWAVNYGKR